MYQTILISCCLALLLACSEDHQPVESSEALLPLSLSKTKTTWQFEAVRDRIVVEQCEKLDDPNAFQPSGLGLD